MGSLGSGRARSLSKRKWARRLRRAHPRERAVKIFISADMEGISGVERVEDVVAGLPGYDVFRRVMAGDVNAVVEGAIQGGATEVVVADGHARMTNIRPSELDPRARLKSGHSRQLLQLKGVSSDFDAALFVGYHAMSSTPNGVLSHTFISSLLDVRLNGASRGEAELNAYVLATLGVPVVFLSGDDTTVAQAREVIGDVEYVQTKRALGRLRAEHLPLKESRRLLLEGARRAVVGLSKRRAGLPLIAEPVTIEVDLATKPPPTMPDMWERNRRFVDSDEDISLSDFESIARYEEVEVVREGTVATRGSTVESYRAVTRLAMHFIERNLTWLGDDVGTRDGYDRDLSEWDPVVAGHGAR